MVFTTILNSNPDNRTRAALHAPTSKDWVEGFSNYGYPFNSTFAGSDSGEGEPKSCHNSNHFPFPFHLQRHTQFLDTTVSVIRVTRRSQCLELDL